MARRYGPGLIPSCALSPTPSEQVKNTAAAAATVRITAGFVPSGGKGDEGGPTPFGPSPYPTPPMLWQCDRVFCPPAGALFGGGGGGMEDSWMGLGVTAILVLS